MNRRRIAIAVAFLVASCLGEGRAQAPNALPSASAGGTSPQTANSTPGIPTFHANARQVIVEADVWKNADKKHPNDTSWIPQSLPYLPDNGERIIELLKGMRPPAPGLRAEDFRVFDNGVEQRINYFKEADFSAASWTTSPWIVDPTTRGIWGTLWLYWGRAPHPPMATYLIGYVPPALQPGECRTVQIVVPNHYVQVSRKQYCAVRRPDAAEAAMDPKLEARMRSFANSTRRGAIEVSTRAFAFWSSGVLSLATQGPATEASPVLPATDFTYVVEVHDSKAPAAVQIATNFGSPGRLWNYPCPKNAAIYILGMVYAASGELAGQFDDTWGCRDMRDSPAIQPIKNAFDTVLVPTLFDTQIELRPGDFELCVVVSDGKKFGRARAHLSVEPLDTNGLTVSDLVLNSILRDASWVVRDATRVTPDPLVPAPLVSKNLEFVPTPDAQIGKGKPLSAYFEIYDPLLETERITVSLRLRITELKTGSLVMNTEPMSTANWVLQGNAVIPMGLKLTTEKLVPGSYQLEVQASDSAGRQSEWRAADFSIR